MWGLETWLMGIEWVLLFRRPSQIPSAHVGWFKPPGTQAPGYLVFLDSMGAYIHVCMQSHIHVIKNKSSYNMCHKASLNNCFSSQLSTNHSKSSWSVDLNNHTWLPFIVFLLKMKFHQAISIQWYSVWNSFLFRFLLKLYSLKCLQDVCLHEYWVSHWTTHVTLAALVHNGTGNTVHPLFPMS